MQDNLLKRLEIMLPAPLQQLSFPPGKTNNSIYVKRDDLIHPVISGNKWRKLSPTLHRLYSSDQPENIRILSFGGGYSNHLHALAYCCHQLNWRLTACIRGDYSHQLTPMLDDMQSWGSELIWLTKSEYKHRTDAAFVSQLCQRYQANHVIPEGGSAQDNLSGFIPFISELPHDIDAIVCPVASGGTMAGLLNAIAQSKRNIDVIGIAVLKGQGYLENLVTDLLPQTGQKIQINHDFHFGGYAKRDAQLEAFCQSFTDTHNIAIEPVYSGKLFYAASTLWQQGQFEQYRRVVLTHTGGLQGAR